MSVLFEMRLLQQGQRAPPKHVQSTSPSGYAVHASQLQTCGDCSRSGEQCATDNDEMDGSNWQHAVLNTTSSRTTTMTTYKRDRERADFQRESRVSNLSNMRSTGAHEPDLSLKASTITTSWSIRTTSRVAVQELQPHTPLLKKPLNAEEEKELTVARVTESHQDT